jgi:NAD+ synthase
VREKPPTAGVVAGQRDAEDLGADYDVIDPVLRLGVDEGRDDRRTARRRPRRHRRTA